MPPKYYAEAFASAKVIYFFYITKFSFVLFYCNEVIILLTTLSEYILATDEVLLCE